MKRPLLLILCMLASLLSACTAPAPQAGSPSSQTDTELTCNPADYYVKTVSYPMINEYIVCCKNPDGSETEIVNMGMQAQQFFISGQRIYFINNGLRSVNFFGEDEQRLSAAKYQMEQISFVNDGWLYVYAIKRDETSEGSAPNGSRHVTVQLRVKDDFSVYEEFE